jgi:hypothetical protein
MIIELIGSSGTGKTTLAEGLAARLKQEGYAVRVVIGRRNRLPSRSLATSIGAVKSWFPGFPHARLAARLMDLLPPRSFIWSMRLRGYISKLCAMSIGCSNTTDIVLVDQGFIQLICSLVLLSGVVDRRRIADALACVPQPDLVIRMEAPLNVLERRLIERRQRLGPIQRLLELDLKMSMAQVEIVKMLCEMLGPQRLVTNIYSDDGSSADVVEKVMSEVQSRLAQSAADDSGGRGNAASSSVGQPGIEQCGVQNHGPLPTARCSKL